MPQFKSVLRLTKGELAALLFILDRFPVDQYDSRRQKTSARSLLYKAVESAPSAWGYDGAVLPLHRAPDTPVLPHLEDLGTTARRILTGKGVVPYGS